MGGGVKTKEWLSAPTATFLSELSQPSHVDWHHLSSVRKAETDPERED